MNRLAAARRAVASRAKSDLPGTRAGADTLARGCRAWAKALQGRTGKVVLTFSVFAAIAGAAVAARLPIQTDISYLLPESALAVRHLRALEGRAQVFAMYMVGIESDDVGVRERTAQLLRGRLAALDRQLVSAVIYDGMSARRFAWNHRFLYADLDDLVVARDALRTRALRLNPLYIDFEEEKGQSPSQGNADSALRRIEARLDGLAKEAAGTDGMISPDGRLQLIVVRTSFSADDLAKGDRLDSMLAGVIAQTRSEVGPGVTIGVTGDVTKTRAERRGLIHGVVVATIVTLVLVMAGLWLYYRSLVAIAALSWSLAVGTLATFAITKLTIGHLNIASAFLSSIVIGNGINFGLILLSRYAEERRSGQSPEMAVETAMVATLPGTLTAAATAGIAYLSLVITPFRGFRHFGLIGGLGMTLCWLSAYSILPAFLLIVDRRGWLHITDELPVARLLARVLPRRPKRVALGAGLAAMAVSLGSLYYLTHDPLEWNLHKLGSKSAELDEASAWMSRFDRVFGFGISGGFVIGVPRRSDAQALLARLRTVDAGKPERERLFSQVSGLDDFLPTQQQDKMAVLTDIRRLIDRLRPHADNVMRARLLRLRPPDGIRPVDDADLPSDLAGPYTERDGTRGRLILANSGLGIDTWHAQDLTRFTRQVRALGMNDDVAIGGTAFVFSDMLAAIERDGPRATMLAAAGAVVAILTLFGFGAAAVTTILCGALGTLGLLTAAWLLSIKINFLDFIALPITIGIGVDYAANMVARGKHLPGRRGQKQSADGMDLYRTGAAVMLCSYTTIVGYGSLLVSQNQGIRSFGLSAMLGEITCLTTALMVVPAALRLLERGTRTPPPPLAPVASLMPSPVTERSESI